MLYAWGKNTDSLSRDHEIYDHKNHGVDGFLTIAGGKLAAYRLLAQEVSDMVATKVGNNKSCLTSTAKLPRAQEELNHKTLTEKYDLSELVSLRLANSHGGGAKKIGTIIEKNLSDSHEICIYEPVPNCR